MLVTGGCVTVQKMDVQSNYCQLSSPLYFSSTATADWLVKNDRDFMEGVISHNNAYERICMETPDDEEKADDGV